MRPCAFLLVLLFVMVATPGPAGDPPVEPPLARDRDEDGLCDRCEREIFLTKPDVRDSDGDGTPDVAEDHDGDGLTNGVELDRTKELIAAAEARDTDRVLELREYVYYMSLVSEEGLAPLLYAAYHGDTATVHALLDAGEDADEQPDRRGWTALTRAVDGGHREIVDTLLRAGADVNHRAGNGNTPLMRAAMYGRTEIARALLEAGADPHAEDISGATALMYASARGSPEIVRMLIGEGVEVDAERLLGETALTEAVENGHPEIVRLLIAAGADVNHRTHNGATPLAIAGELSERFGGSYGEVVELLVEAGAGE